MPVEALVMITRIIDVGHRLEALLGRPAHPGLALLEAHLAGHKGATVQDIAARSKCSEDTSRRRLEELVEARRARHSIYEGRHCYSICPRTAAAVLRTLTEHGSKLHIPKD